MGLSSQTSGWLGSARSSEVEPDHSTWPLGNMLESLRPHPGPVSQTAGRGPRGSGFVTEAQRRCPFAEMAPAGLEMPVRSMVSLSIRGLKWETSNLPFRNRHSSKKRITVGPGAKLSLAGPGLGTLF